MLKHTVSSTTRFTQSLSGAGRQSILIQRIKSCLTSPIPLSVLSSTKLNTLCKSPTFSSCSSTSSSSILHTKNVNNNNSKSNKNVGNNQINFLNTLAMLLSLLAIFMDDGV
eukprot:TRINITY_DN13470_c0_g1_i1.p1 TRINITY_DN13470_c0_g1~~TRINITY_DN13470_c0_g1_i1.p1  ORF type:complete len:111 (-),score=13.99 TRINITY_DN13470_c0_g1_i1:8-340(-)